MPPTPVRSTHARESGRRRGARGARAVLVPLVGVCLPLAALVAPASAARPGSGSGGTVARTVIDLGPGNVGDLSRIDSTPKVVVVVGSAEVNGIEHAVSWRHTTGTTDTSASPTDLNPRLGAIRSAASGVDTSGTIVGWMQDSAGAQRNFRIAPDGGVSVFAGTPPATSPSGKFLAGGANGQAVRWSGTTPQVLDSRSGTGAAAVDDTGAAVGSLSFACTALEDPNKCTRLVVWSSPGSARDVNSPAGWLQVNPTAITSATTPAVVVGYGNTATASIPFALPAPASPNSSPVLLPVPTPRHGGAPSSRALDVTDTGLIVGGVGAQAAEWTPSGGSWSYKDISGLGSGSGWRFNDARAIDGQGDIVGAGVRSGSSQHAYLLLP